jgi:hypothetical protein
MRFTPLQSLHPRRVRVYSRLTWAAPPAEPYSIYTEFSGADQAN